MKRLTLLRHAQADNALPDQRDWDRALTKRGLLDAAEMARRLKAIQPAPQLILSSPAIRAQQTAEIFARAFIKAQLEFSEALYLADTRTLLSVLQHRRAVRHLLLVGHNPGLSELADQLSGDGRIEGMPTASWVSMHFAIENWPALRPASGTDAEFDYPQRPA